jgi:hypothetical protein
MFKYHRPSFGSNSEMQDSYTHKKREQLQGMLVDICDPSPQEINVDLRGELDPLPSPLAPTSVNAILIIRRLRGNDVMSVPRMASAQRKTVCLKLTR